MWTNVRWPWNLHIVRGSDDVCRVNPGHGHSEFFPCTPHVTQSDVIVRSQQAAIVPKDEFFRIKFRPNLETKQMHRFEVSAHTVNIINLYAVSGKLDTYMWHDHVCVVHTSLRACLLVCLLIVAGGCNASNLHKKQWHRGNEHKLGSHTIIIIVGSYSALSYVNPRHVHFILKLKNNNMKPHNINMHKFVIKHLSHIWSGIVVLTPYSGTWSSDQPVMWPPFAQSHSWSHTLVLTPYSDTWSGDQPVMRPPFAQSHSWSLTVVPTPYSDTWLGDQPVMRPPFAQSHSWSH